MGKSLGSSRWTLKNDEIYVVWKHQAPISPWNWDGNIGGIEILKCAFSNLEGSQHVGNWEDSKCENLVPSSHGTFICWRFLSSNHLSDLSDLSDNIRYQTPNPPKVPQNPNSCATQPLSPLFPCLRCFLGFHGHRIIPVENQAYLKPPKWQFSFVTSPSKIFQTSFFGGLMLGY